MRTGFRCLISMVVPQPLGSLWLSLQNSELFKAPFLSYYIRIRMSNLFETAVARSIQKATLPHKGSYNAPKKNSELLQMFPPIGPWHGLSS